MKDLMRAIEVEEEYLKLLSDREQKEKFNLHERLELCGYSVDEYHKDKNEFLVSVSPKNFRLIRLEDLHAEEDRVMQNNDSAFLVVVPDKKWVYVGKASTIDVPDASYIDMAHPCASILSTPKDLGLVCVVKHRRACEFYHQWLVDELDKIGLHPEILSAEKAYDGHSVYYLQMYFDGAEREGVVARWLR
jgi:hypothetical protein